MVDNINLMIAGSNDCWVAKFMHSMAHIGIISHQNLNACKLVDDYTALAISEASVKAKLQSLWHGMCQEVFGASADPRSIPDTVPNTYVRYRAWVTADRPPLHLTAFIPISIKHMLIRFRSTSFPLAIQAGRCAKHKIPRSQRLCMACSNGHAEDDKHFLLECTAYAHIRERFPTIFTSSASPASILNTPDQGLLGQAMKIMIAHRSNIS